MNVMLEEDKKNINNIKLGGVNKSLLEILVGFY